MKAKVLTNLNLLFNFFIFFFVGLIILVNPIVPATLFKYILSITFLVFGIYLFLSSLFNKKKIINILVAILTFGFGLAVMLYPAEMSVLFPIVVGNYILLIGLLKLSVYLVYKTRGYPGFIRMFVASLLDILIALILLVNPFKAVNILFWIRSLLYSFSYSYLRDFFRAVFPRFRLLNFRHIRITLPILLSAFIPYRFSKKW